MARAPFLRDPPPLTGPEAILDRAGPVVRERMARTEERLVAISRATSASVSGHAVATIAAGGKRLRPLLVFVAGGDYDGENGDDEPLVRAAVAVELVHSATLVHDDVLDGAALRRGRPTVVAAAGRSMATAVGDLLFSRAFAELVRNESVEQLRALSRAGTALAGGELVQREDAHDTSVTRERYLWRCELKTGRLFEAACRLGALAGAGPADAEALAGFGRRIGLAFQLLDDILDVSGPATRTGKQRGADLLDGTVTLPFILARERDPDLACVQLREIAGPEEAERLCDRIAATGALREAKTHALELVAGARAALPADLDASQRELLERIAWEVVERYR
jgi:geranylgeranyl pyrophosphate synthase